MAKRGKDGRHSWYEADHTKEQVFRRDLRAYGPKSRDGFVVEDLDLILRRYSKKDGKGRFYLAEVKKRGSKVNMAQRKTFGLIGEVLVRGDPHRRHYMGFALVEWAECNDGAHYWVTMIGGDGVKRTIYMKPREFAAWASMESDPFLLMQGT